MRRTFGQSDMKRKEQDKRYSASLLFQYRVMVNGDPGRRRLCEKRVITFRAGHGRAALAEAKKRGRGAQHSYKNAQGNRVHFEFVGVRELLCLDPACASDEVWYQIVELMTPMERKKALIPPKARLNAIRNND